MAAGLSKREAIGHSWPHVSPMYQDFGEVAMTWKPTGRPVVRQQRDRWVVRVDGIDTASGKSRPRQLGTFRSRRAAQKAASEFGASGEVGSDRSTVGSVVTRWAESRTDIGNKSRLQYEWAAGHSVRQSRLLSVRITASGTVAGHRFAGVALRMTSV
jgi:hypothetical protein